MQYDPVQLINKILDIDKTFIYLVHYIVFAFPVSNFWKLKVQFYTNVFYLIILLL